MNGIKECTLIMLVGFSGMINAMDMVMVEDGKQNLKQSLDLLELERCLLEGKLYFYGEGRIEPDYKRAFECFNKVVDQGADFALKKESAYFLGLMYVKGLGVKEDAQKAELYLNEINTQEIAQKFDVQVDYELGVIFCNDKNYVKAREYFEKAADQDKDKGAQGGAWRYLGSLYAEGHEIAQDYGKAREYYEKAAAQDANKEAQAWAWYGLGYLYNAGRGVRQDYVKAREYFEKVVLVDANLEVQARAWSALGILYQDGSGIAQDYIKAREYFEKAAAQDASKEAQAWAWWFLGKLYANGHGVTQDYARAREYYEKAAAQDDNKEAQAFACFNVGHLYADGKGGAQDLVKARDYYEKAAEHDVFKGIVQGYLKDLGNG